MPIRFRLLTEADVKAVLTMDDLIETMTSALRSFSTGAAVQPVRAIVPVNEHAFFGAMPAFVRGTTSTAANFGAPGPQSTASGSTVANFGAALGAKLVTVFESNTEHGLPTHLASIALLDPETGALRALLDGRYITEARTGAVSAVTSRLLARKGAASLAIIGSGVQARSHLDALSRVHQLRYVTVWSPTKAHRDQFVKNAGDGLPPSREASADHRSLGGGGQAVPSDAGRAALKGVPYTIKAVDHAGEAIVGADLIVLATSSPTPVIEDGWVKPGAHIMSVGACRPNQREMDPALVARARFFVDSRAAALVESGDLVMGMQEGRFGPDHIVAEIGEVVSGAVGRQRESDITIFKSLGMAVEDVTAADLAYRRAVDRGIGRELTF